MNGPAPKNALLRPNAEIRYFFVKKRIEKNEN